jgi:CheY-like chemotaxis protein
VRWPPVILVAEDNDDEFVLLRCAFESAGLPHRLIGVVNGAEALAYLYADDVYSNRAAYPFPDLMLLDQRMPVMDGFQVLAALNGRIEFQSLPIIVLSSMNDPKATRMALRLGAKDCILKPLTISERIDMVRSLCSRWLAGRDRPPSQPTNFNSWGYRASDQDQKKPAE